jgi:hypothetical protein
MMDLPGKTLQAQMVRSLDLVRPGAGEAHVRRLRQRLDRHLVLLERHIVDAEARVARQDQLVNSMSQAADRALACDLLAIFVDVLERLHAHHQSVMRELAELESLDVGST